MKHFTTLLLLTLNTIAAHAAQTKILWIGNSYTYVNDLPTMFHNLALSGGDTVVFDSYAIGGYTLQQQAQDTTCQHKIKSQQWDYVVIQAQSQEPSIPTQQFNTQTLPYAIILDSLVHANNTCSKTVWYMTWGKKHGDAGNCSGFPVLCTFDGVTSQLRKGYQAMADTTHAIMAPVGMAWQARWHTDTTINMWQSDESHPTPQGTYLTACVIYGTIFRKSPIGLSFSAISPQWAIDTMQYAASRTVFDSLATWHIGIYDPKAVFTYTVDTATKTVQLTPNGSINYTSLLWDYGDGSASSTNSTHTYTDSGSYAVKLTVLNNCGLKDSATQVLAIHDTIATPDTTTHTGIALVDAVGFSISPNPVTDILSVDLGNQNATKFEIYNTLGQMFLTSNISTNAKLNIGVHMLPRGVYLFKLGSFTERFVKL